MSFGDIIRKVKLKSYIAMKKHKHGLSIWRKNKWSDKYFSHGFSDIDFKIILDLEDYEKHRRFYTSPYSSMKNIESNEYNQYILSRINEQNNEQNIENYIQEVEVYNIVGDCLSNNCRNYKSLYDYIEGSSLRTESLQNFMSYYYLFNMDKSEFIQRFINKDITFHLAGIKMLPSINTVYLIKKENNYYVIENGRHRVLIAKILGMGKIKAIVFNAD